MPTTGIILFAQAHCYAIVSAELSPRHFEIVVADLAGF
jgi:hypothetical protein